MSIDDAEAEARHALETRLPSLVEWIAQVWTEGYEAGQEATRAEVSEALADYSVRELGIDLDEVSE